MIYGLDLLQLLQKMNTSFFKTYSQNKSSQKSGRHENMVIIKFLSSEQKHDWKNFPSNENW